QREEVEVVFGGLAGGGRRQQHGFVVEVGDDGACSLLGEAAGFESDGAGAEAPVVDDGGRLEDAVLNFCDRHYVSVRPLWVLIQLFRVVTPRTLSCPSRPGASMRLRPSIEAAGVDTPAATTEDRPIRRVLTDAQERCTRNCENRTNCSRRNRLTNAPMLHGRCLSDAGQGGRSGSGSAPRQP